MIYWFNCKLPTTMSKKHGPNKTESFSIPWRSDSPFLLPYLKRPESLTYILDTKFSRQIFLHPGKLIWNSRSEWRFGSDDFPFQKTVIFRFHANFRGRITPTGSVSGILGGFSLILFTTICKGDRSRQFFFGRDEI